MVYKVLVLLWIQYFQHGRCWVSLKVTGHLVNFIQKDYWVFRLGLFHGIYNSTWYGPYIGPSMTPDFSLIPDTTK